MQPPQSSTVSSRSPYFISREIVVPDDELDDEFSEALVAGASALSSRTSTSASQGSSDASMRSRSSGPILPALPDSLMDALNREPPPVPASPRSSSSAHGHSGTPSTPPNRLTAAASPLLPKIAKHSPIGFGSFGAAGGSPPPLRSHLSQGPGQLPRLNTVKNGSTPSISIDALDVATTPRQTTRQGSGGFASNFGNLSEGHIATGESSNSTKRSILRMSKSRERSAESLDDLGASVPPRGIDGPAHSRLLPRGSSASLGTMLEDRALGLGAPLGASTSFSSEVEDPRTTPRQDDDMEESDGDEAGELVKGATRWTKSGRGETYTVDLGGSAHDDDDESLTHVEEEEERDDDEQVEEYVETSQTADVQAFVHANSPPDGYISSGTDEDEEVQSSSPVIERTPRTSPTMTRRSEEANHVAEGLKLLAIDTAPVVASTPSPRSPTPPPGIADFASSRNATSPTVLSPASFQSSADFVVAVVGPRDVGKSTVIRRGLKRPAGKPIVLAQDEQENRVTTCTSHFTISGQARSIEVLEIDMGLLNYNAEGVIWPKGLPPCDGAMLCYDSTDPKALEPLSRLLQAFWTRGSDVPLIVLACKANAEAKVNATDPNKAAAVCNVYGAGIVSLDGGAEDRGRKMKESFNWMIRTIMDNRGESRRASSVASVATGGSRSTSPTQTRRESASTSHGEAVAMARARSSSSARARVESTVGVSFADPFGGSFLDTSEPSTTPMIGSTPNTGRSSRGDSIGMGVGLGLSIVEEAPVATPADTARRPSASSGRLGLKTVADDPLAAATTSTAPSRPSQELATKSRRPSSIKEPPSRRVSGEANDKGGKPTSLDLFFSREDMIDKFLFASVTGNDEKYVTLFLIVFRRFARPHDVLSKLIERFKFVAGRLKTDPLLSRFAQMKLCGTLSTWFSVYPGDFSAPATLDLLRPFLEGLLPSGATWVAHYAVDMLPKLDTVSQMQDPEATWALPDKTLDEDALAPTGQQSSPMRRPSLGPSLESSTSSLEQNAPSMSESLGNSFHSHLGVPGSSVSTHAPPSMFDGPGGAVLRERVNSEARTVETLDTDAGSINDESIRSTMSGSTSSLRKGMTTSGLSLLEISNALIDATDEAIALQITRITWEAFSDITPRDLIRHVLAPRDPSDPSRALRDENSNVKRSIALVNYLANWVASVTLVQPKLKWRARILEKLFGVAYCLREQENFDALMGVLAGLNLQPLFRMKELKETVWLKLGGDRENAPKRLRSLYRLMANTKSFAAYRLAIASSSANMLPYLGVHLQDITTINEVKSDMRDGKVNWSKFQKMGESAAVVLNCARLAPALPVDKSIERCILDAPLLSEQEQYELSKLYEPQGVSKATGKATGARAKLRNLAERSPFFA